MLAGNRDLDRVVTMPAARGTMASLALALRLFKRYDLAVSTQSGDRPTFFALLAGRRHVGPIDGGRRGALRQMALSRAVPNVPGLHRLEEMLRLADALGIERVPLLACPGGAAPRRFARRPLCSDPCGAAFHLQAMDPRRLARARRPACATAASRSSRPAARRRRSVPSSTTSGAKAVRSPASTAPCRGRNSPRCWPRRAFMSVPIPRSPILPRRAGARPSRCMGRPTRGCGARCPPPGSNRCGRRLEPSSAAAMSGWCKILCPACRARTKAASAISRASAAAWTSSCRRRSCKRWIVLWIALDAGQRLAAGTPAPLQAVEAGRRGGATAQRPLWMTRPERP